jgi:hypothetical protein
MVLPKPDIISKAKVYIIMEASVKLNRTLSTTMTYFAIMVLLAALGVGIPKQSFGLDLNDLQARLEYQRSIPVTHWAPADTGKPLTYQEWLARTGEPGPFKIEFLKRSSPPPGREDPVIFLVIVNPSTYGHCATAILRYIDDMTAENYDVQLYISSGGTPNDLRTFLQQQYAAGMAGCVLIGNLPVPWFETYCWDAYDAFPVDLFYMDMDGSWFDGDSNGLYDTHTGDRGPEIYVGRLTASPLTFNGSDEETLLNNYFEKNNRYRTGQDFLNNRALVYIDDDWAYWASEWSGNVGLVYPVRTLVSDAMTTQAPDYESRLPQNYESILLCAHSSPEVHAFKIPPDLWEGGETWNFEIPEIDPVAHFYNLFACSNARYVEYDYMAGWYIFCQSHGLAAIGSTKTGSMLYFEYFYGPFASGKTIGESFLDWFTTISSWGFPQDDVCWFYGMTLCGDPTLRHLSPDPVVITTPVLPDGQFNTPYSCLLEATGGIPSYIWQVYSGTLPDGLVLDSSSGLISGSPAESGTFALTIRATDAGIPPLFDIKEFSLKINFLCGDANNDGHINILDITYLIAYLYLGGPAPIPLEAADVNGTPPINILDIAYMIDNLYKGGPDLVCQ